MSPFEIESGELLAMGESDLRELLDSPYKIDHGLILFCLSGAAEIGVELHTCQMRKYTAAVLIPGTILTLNSVDEGFKVTYISFSRSLFDEAVFRLDPPFFRFIKDNPCYTHLPKDAEIFSSIMHLIRLNYQDRKNMFREVIAKNQLQNFFLDMYDKTREAFTSRQRNGSNRAEELFRKFIASIQAHYLAQKDVAFYAGELCISARYLSAVTRQITGDSAKTIIDRHIILEIKVMLRSTEMTIQEIANRLDFPNQSYLGRYFKKHTGKSPVDYRNKRK